MNKLLSIILVLIFVVAANAEFIDHARSGLPSGCSNGQVGKWNSTTFMWECAADSTGGSPTFDAVATGSNTTAVMTCASGCTLVTSAGIFRVPNGTSLPATCTVGDAFMDTDATSGSRWYLCEATNSWVVQGGSASSLAFSGITAGTNTAALVIGNSGSLGYTGTGYIDANRFAGVTAVDATEFGYLDGVTSGIQSQLNAKQASDADLTTIAGLSVTRGGLMAGSASPAWSVLAVGSANTVLKSDGTDAAWGTVTGSMMTSNTVTATQLAATLTFADGDLVDLSGITHTGSTDEGLVLPTWANVTPTSNKKFLAADGSSLKLYNGGWVTIGATAAPTDAKYWTSSPDATLSQEVNLGALTTGLLKITVTGGEATPSIASAGTDYVAPAGNVATATALAADPTDCSANQFATAIAASGNLTCSQPTPANLGNGTLASTFTVGTGGSIAVSGTGTNQATSMVAGSGSITLSGPTTARVVTIDDAAQTLAARNTANTFTENNTFGNADTDTLTVRSLIVGGGSRAVWIAGSAPTPTYATGTNELYVAGDIETAGTVYAAALNTGSGTDGSRALTFTTNTSMTCSGNQMYFLNNVAKLCENGTERDIVVPSDSVTWTGTTHSFAGVTNFVLPTAAADAAGEMSIDTTNHQLKFHAGGASADNAVQSFDFDSCSSGYVLKTDGSGNWTCQADATGSSPTLNSISNPTADTTIAMDAGEEVNFQYTGNFTTGSQFLIQQLTGNPSGGVVFEVRVADSDATAARIGDGTNYINISQAGAMTAAGTGSITATALTGAVAGATSVDIGNADTTISRSAAGIIAVEGANVIMGTLGATTNVIPKANGTGTVTLQASGITENGTSVDIGALNLVSTGYSATSINNIGTFASPTTTNPYSLTAANARGSILWYGATGEIDLPAATAGMNLCIYNTGAFTITIDPNGTDVIVRDGTAQSAGVSFTLSSGAGNYVCMTADAANHWVTLGYKGTLAQGS